MVHRIRTPPGRAGRLWLRDRLALADRAVSLLDTKVRLLRRELDRLELLAARAEQQWLQELQSAREWQQRALLAGGERDFRLMAARDPADVSVTSVSVMGVEFPGSIECRTPDHPADQPWTGSSAMHPARRAFAAAVRAAADSGAARLARDTLSREVVSTSQRLRALRDRWIPALQETLHTVEAALDEVERTDSARLRWVDVRRERRE